MKETIKKIMCMAKKHDLDLTVYDDFTDTRGAYVAGIVVKCHKCGIQYQSHPLQFFNLKVGRDL